MEKTKVKNIKTKDERIKSEYNKIKKFFKNADKTTMSIADPLIHRAAFMHVALEDLEATINENGAVEEYQNGANQKGVKLSAEVQAYNQTVKSYNMVNKRIEELMPKQKAKSKLQELMDND